jgi:hypothetical protein
MNDMRASWLTMSRSKIFGCAQGSNVLIRHASCGAGSNLNKVLCDRTASHRRWYEDVRIDIATKGDESVEGKAEEF